jgi:cell division septum initiation protein DivIVA
MSIEEQQQPPNGEDTSIASDGVTRDDLLAAVREAGGTASVVDQVATEAAAKNDPPVEPEPAAAPPPAADDPLERIMRAREKAHAETMAARNAADEIRRQAEAERTRIIEEAKAEARRAVEQEQNARRARLDASPIEALRELGRDPNQVVDAVLSANTPEARERARLAADLETLRAEAKVGKTAAEELKELRAAMQTEQQLRVVEQAQRSFFAEHATAEKAPYLHARYDASEIWERSNRIYNEWTQAGLVLNGQGENGFAPSDIVAYLERQSKERISKVAASPAPPAQQVSAGAVARPPGNAPQVSANGPRTLSAAQGSERRTSPKPLSEMSSEQARQALIDEVAAARRNNPDAAF